MNHQMTKFDQLRYLQNSSIRTDIPSIEGHKHSPPRRCSISVVVLDIMRRQVVVSVMSAVVMCVVHIFQYEKY